MSSGSELAPPPASTPVSSPPPGSHHPPRPQAPGVFAQTPYSPQPRIWPSTPASAWPQTPQPWPGSPWGHEAVVVHASQHEAQLNAEAAKKAAWAEELRKQKQRAERALEQQRLWAESMKVRHLEETGLPMYPDPHAASELLQHGSSPSDKAFATVALEKRHKVKDEDYDDPVDAGVTGWRGDWIDADGSGGEEKNRSRRRRGRGNKEEVTRWEDEPVRPYVQQAKAHNEKNAGYGWERGSEWKRGGGYEHGGYNERGSGWEADGDWQSRRGGGEGGRRGGGKSSAGARSSPTQQPTLDTIEIPEPKVRARGKFLTESAEAAEPPKVRSRGKFAREEPEAWTTWGEHAAEGGASRTARRGKRR